MSQVMPPESDATERLDEAWHQRAWRRPVRFTISGGTAVSAQHRISPRPSEGPRALPPALFMNGESFGLSRTSRENHSITERNRIVLAGTTRVLPDLVVAARGVISPRSRSDVLHSDCEYLAALRLVQIRESRSAC